ncbi:MAG TPA: hypothetical protein VF043_34635 [Ktedonobacteraceae bacterium]
MTGIAFRAIWGRQRRLSRRTAAGDHRTLLRNLAIERCDRMKSRDMASSEARSEPSYQRRMLLCDATRPIVPYPPPRLWRMSRLPLAWTWKGGSIMPEAVLSPLATWHNFYVLIGTAAATLTGLIFVVATLIARVRVRVSSPDEAFATFSTPNVVHFGAALLVAALLSAPWQALWPAGLLLGLSGLGGMIYVVIVLRRARRQTDYQPVLEDWLWHTVFPLVSYTALVVAALLLPGHPAPALFVIAAATVLLLFIGIHNAWDNVTYIALELSRPQNTSQD